MTFKVTFQLKLLCDSMIVIIIKLKERKNPLNTKK